MPGAISASGDCEDRWGRRTVRLSDPRDPLPDFTEQRTIVRIPFEISTPSESDGSERR